MIDWTLSQVIKKGSGDKERISKARIKIPITESLPPIGAGMNSYFPKSPSIFSFE